MEKEAFYKYKKTMSLILCCAYILQLAAFCFVHRFLTASEDEGWVFLIGFWGINFMMIVLVRYFHEGKPEFLRDYTSTSIFLGLTGGIYFSLSHRMDWLTIALVGLISLLIFVLRYGWTRKFSCKYGENTDYLKEEAVIRFSLYIFPAILLAVVGRHVEDVIPHSFLSLFVCVVCFTIAFSLIVPTYIMWYRNLEKAVPYKELAPDLIWLLGCFLVFVTGVQSIGFSPLSLLLPIIGIVPVLLRHKET